MPQARSGGGSKSGGSRSKSGGSRSTRSAGSRSSASKAGSSRSSSGRSGAAGTTARSAASRSTKSGSTARKTTSARGSARTTRSRATGATDARVEAAAQRVRKLNERIIEVGKDAGESTLSSYEKILKSIASTIERGPGSSDIDWVADLATAQAKFIRDLTTSWTTAARKMLK